MIPTPRGWRRELRGHEVRLESDQTVARITYAQRYGPLRSAREVVAERLARTAALASVEIGEPERLVTDEGEFAALVGVTGRVGHTSFWRWFGVVFGDNFTSLLDAVCVDAGEVAELEATVRDLVVQTALMLGVRKRRFMYTPPPAWQPLANVFVTNWYPPGFPRTSACITVYPATPARPADARQVLEASILEERARGSSVILAGEATPIATRSGLSGTAWQLVIRPPSQPERTRDLVALEDARYLYPLRLDAHTDQLDGGARAAFLELVASAEAIPGRPEPESLEAFSIWLS
jgi:hypothetical protein